MNMFLKQKLYENTLRYSSSCFMNFFFFFFYFSFQDFLINLQSFGWNYVVLEQSLPLTFRAKLY